MSNTEHLANVMVEAFIAAVESGVDLVPVVADSLTPEPATARWPAPTMPLTIWR